MLYVIEEGNWCDRYKTPLEFDEDGCVDLFEFIKITSAVPLDNLVGCVKRPYYIYDYETVRNIILELYSEKEATSFASGEELYYFRKMLGIFDNEVSQQLVKVEKEYFIKHSINGYSDELLDKLEEIMNNIFDMSTEIIKQKIKGLGMDAYKEIKEDSLDIITIDNEKKIVIDKQFYTSNLKALLKNHTDIPLNYLKCLMSVALYRKLVEAKIEDLSDLLIKTKYVSLEVPTLTSLEEKELVDLVHSCGCLFFDETEKEVTNEIFDSITLYDWTNPAKPTSVRLTTRIENLPLSVDSKKLLMINNIYTFGDLIRLSYKELKKMILEDKKYSEIKQLVLRCNINDYVKNSDNISYPNY